MLLMLRFITSRKNKSINILEDASKKRKATNKDAARYVKAADSADVEAHANFEGSAHEAHP